MTLDQSLANLQHQADRLANLFASTADAIEAARAPELRVAKAISNAVVEPPAAEMPMHWGYADGSAPAPTPQPAPSFSPEQLQASFDAAMASGEAPSGVVPNGSPMLNQTPQGASPSSAPTMAVPPASAVEVEGPDVRPSETPRPAGPTPEAPPWEGETTAAAPVEKKSGRRTNEEIAAELGVDLDAVKKWKGGGRISRKDMEEYARLFPAAVVGPQVAPFAQPQPAAEPMPTQASDPMGAPQYNQGGVLPAAAPTAAAPAQGPPQEWPVAQPVPAQPTQGEQFGEWQQAAASDSQWDPFKA